MEWKVKDNQGHLILVDDSYTKQGTMPMDRAKIEAARAIAQELETQNNWLEKIYNKMPVE